jgi:hypothetical protein
MRKSRFLLAVAAVAVGLYLFRRSRLPRERRDRFLRRTMNERLTPILLRHGAADGPRTGLGIVEHVGRASGTLRRTIIHPIPLADRFALPLSYGENAPWPQNVMAAGRCRLQYRDSVYKLTNPRAVGGSQIEGLPRAEEMIGRMVGDRYLLMDVDSVAPGRLADGAGERVVAGSA